MTDERNTGDFDKDAAAITARYRRASTEQPPEALDARILAAARDSIAAPPAKRTAWRPLALAAVVVLSATLVLTMRPPDQHAFSDETVAAEDPTMPADVDAAPEPAAAPSRSMAVEQVDTAALEEIVVTGSRVAAEEDVAAGAAEAKAVAAKAVARLAEREQSMPASLADMSPEDTPPGAYIDAIRSAWEAGDREAAQRLLDAFADAYPDYPEADLREALPEALLEYWPRQ